MHRTPKRPPVYSTSPDTGPIATVRLANGLDAILDAPDMEELILRGFPTAWTFNDNGTGSAYVRTPTTHDNLVTVAREIMNPAPGECVKYRNGNRRDLRRANLYLTNGARRARKVAA